MNMKLSKWLAAASLGACALAQAAPMSFCKGPVKVDVSATPYNAWKGQILSANGSDAILTAAFRFRTLVIAGDIAGASQYVLPQHRLAFTQELADETTRLALAGQLALVNGQQAYGVGLVDWSPYKVLVGKVTQAGQPDIPFTQAFAYDRGTPYIAWSARQDPVAATAMAVVSQVLGSTCPAGWTIGLYQVTLVDSQQLRFDAVGIEAPAQTLPQVAVWLRGRPMNNEHVYPAPAAGNQLAAVLATFLAGQAAGDVNRAAPSVYYLDRPEYVADLSAPGSANESAQFWSRMASVTASGSFTYSGSFHVLFTDLQARGGPSMPVPYQFHGANAAITNCIGSEACSNALKLRYGDSGTSTDPFLTALSTFVRLGYGQTTAQLRYSIVGP